MLSLVRERDVQPINQHIQIVDLMSSHDPLQRPLELNHSLLQIVLPFGVNFGFQVLKILRAICLKFKYDLGMRVVFDLSQGPVDFTDAVKIIACQLMSLDQAVQSELVFK